MAAILETQRRSIETATLEERLIALEQRTINVTQPPAARPEVEQ